MIRELWNRRAFFDSYGSRPAEAEAPTPQFGIRISCPCCGYPTIHDRQTFEICFLCGWEDDGQDDDDADEVRGGPNQSYSLDAARANFAKYLVKHEPENDTRAGGANTEQERELKRMVIAAFDRMADDPPAGELSELWRVVRDGERNLYQALRDRIRRYEHEHA